MFPLSIQLRLNFLHAVHVSCFQSEHVRLLASRHFLLIFANFVLKAFCTMVNFESIFLSIEATKKLLLFLEWLMESSEFVSRLFIVNTFGIFILFVRNDFFSCSF